MARGPRAFRPVEYRSTARRARAPRSADLAWLCCGPTRGALLPTPSVWARPHQHRDRSAARASEVNVHRVRIRGARPARFSPRGVSADRHRARAAQCGLGVVVLWANAGRAPPHAVGRGSTAPTPRQVGGTASKVSRAPRSSPDARARALLSRGVSADRPRSTRTAQCGLGVVVLWPNAGRAPPHAIGRGSTAPTPRQVGGTASKVLATAFISCGAQPARFSPCGVSADRPRSTRAAQCGLGVVVLWANAGALLPTPSAEARPHQHRDRSAARASKCVATAFESRGARRARFRPVEYRPTAHGARARAVRTWRGCVVGQRGARSSPRRRPGLDRTNTATGRRHRRRRCIVTSFESSGARPARISPREVSADRPRSTRTAQCGLGVVVLWPNAGRAPPHAVGWARPHQHRDRSAARLRKLVFTAFESRGARPARFSPRGVSADRLRSTRRAVRTWRGCVVAQRGARSSPRRRLGSTAPTPRQVGGTSFESSCPPRSNPWCAARALFAPWSIGRPPTEHVPRSADLAWLCCGPTRGALLTAVGRGSTAPTPRQVGGTGFEISQHLVRVSLREPARFSPVEYRPTAHGARARAVRGLCVVVLWPNAGRAPPTPSAGARPHQHRDRSVARASKVHDRCVRIPWRAARALIASWSIGRPPTEHAPRSADLAWLCCGQRRALLPPPSAEARPHQHRDRSAGTRFES